MFTFLSKLWDEKPYVMAVVGAVTALLSYNGVHIPPELWALETALGGAAIHSSIKANA